MSSEPWGLAAAGCGPADEAAVRVVMAGFATPGDIAADGPALRVVAGGSVAPGLRPAGQAALRIIAPFGMGAGMGARLSRGRQGKEEEQDGGKAVHGGSLALRHGSFRAAAGTA
jgi:hypothetical protein